MLTDPWIAFSSVAIGEIANEKEIEATWMRASGAIVLFEFYYWNSILINSINSK